jgi:hypothetical protein
MYQKITVSFTSAELNRLKAAAKSTGGHVDVFVLSAALDRAREILPKCARCGMTLVGPDSFGDYSDEDGQLRCTRLDGEPHALAEAE